MRNNDTQQPLVSVDDLAANLHDPGWVIVDCRFNLMEPNAGREAYESGHIQGAFYADLDKDLASTASAQSGGRHPLPEVRKFARLLASWGLGPESMLVAYDDAGGAVAARLWWLVRWMGHARVALLDGGLRAWQAAGRELSDAPALVPENPGGAYGTPGHMPVVSVAEIEKGLESERLLLLDARAADRFGGRNELLDPVAGHVPGAYNSPFQDNLGADGLFLAPAALRASYASIIGSRPTSEIACMCGSGVTACHTLFALEVAGVTGAALYVGSWSDWVSSAHRPVTTD